MLRFSLANLTRRFQGKKLGIPTNSIHHLTQRNTFSNFSSKPFIQKFSSSYSTQNENSTIPSQETMQQKADTPKSSRKIPSFIKWSLYLVLLYLFVEQLTDWFQRMYQKHHKWMLSESPWFATYIVPIFQVLEGIIRCLRTSYVCILMAADYYYHLYHVSDFSENEELNHKVHQRNADRLLALFEKNQTIYTKVGQYMSTLQSILPNEYCTTLSVLQDRAPPVSFSEIEMVLEQEFGKSVKELFQSIDEKPIACASLAQVHKATLLQSDGKSVPVAVKVQYPRVLYHFEGDMLTHRLIIMGMNLLFPNFDMKFIQEDMAQYLRTELNFEKEANNSKRCKANYQTYRKDIHVPTVFDQVSSKRVLTTEWIDNACKINDVQGMKKLGIDKTAAAHFLMEAFAEQIFMHGLIHTDCHPGNVFVRKNPNNAKEIQLVILDHGLYKEISNAFRIQYAKLWRALVLRDDEQIKQYCQDLQINDHVMFSSLILMRSYDGALVGMSNSITKDEMLKIKHKFQEELDKMLKLIRSLPKEVLMIMRCMNLLRSINHELGVPVNRFVIMAQVAARGAVLEKSIDPFSANRSEYYTSFEVDQDYTRGFDAHFKSNKTSIWQKFKSMREAMKFSIYLWFYSLAYKLVDWYSRFAIQLGIAQRLEIEEIEQEGGEVYAPAA